MERTDLPRLVRVLTRHCEVSGRRVSDDLAEAFLAGLGDVPIERVERASVVWLRSQPRMPSPADLRHALDESIRSRAAAAWAAVRPHLRKACAGAWNDPITVRVLHLLGGFERIGSSSSEDVDQWIRREFLDRYEDLARRERDLRSLEAGTSGSRALGRGESDDSESSSPSPEGPKP